MTSGYPLTFWWLLALTVVVSAATSAGVTYALLSTRFRRPGEPALPEGKPGRRRRRYVAFEVLTANEPSRNDVESSILESFRRLYGDVGLASSGLKLVEYDPAARRGILRVWSTSLDKALASLGYVRRVGNSETLLVPLAVSGTIRGARSKAFRSHERRG